MINQVQQTEVRDLVYQEVRQPFTEKTNLSPDTLKEGSFTLKEKKERIIFSANRTIVILNDGTKGIAKCLPSDKYNKLKGIKIAYLRARIESFQKELEELCK